MIDKSKFYDSAGKYLTQSLFLELTYNTEFAVYSLKDYDHTYEGHLYPSLKRLYIEEEDVVEYNFVNKYLANWKQWQRLCDNKIIRKHIDEWRNELELKLRSQAIKDIINISAKEDGSFQAAKYLADKGWIKVGAGRPNKKEADKERKLAEIANSEFEQDFLRLIKK